MSKLSVIIKYEIFMSRLDIALARYPKAQKYAFRTRTDNKAVDVWEALIEAEFYYKVEYKTKALNKALLDLRKLQAFLRLAKDRGFLGYLSKDDMRYVKQTKEEKKWQRELTQIEKQRKSEVWMKNALMEFTKLTKMLSECESEIVAWLNSFKK